MPASSAPDLEAFWYEPDPTKLRCLSCGGDFVDRALVRTFLVNNHDDTLPDKYTSSIHVPHLQRDLILFDRHLICLVDSTVVYYAVSHVWEPRIAIAQQSGRGNPTETSRETRQLTIEKPVRAYQGLTGIFGKEGPSPEETSRQAKKPELWHDYISVPQWTPLIKDNILGVIHDIFASAHATIVHFDDISPGTVGSLYRDETSEDRCNALLDICNAQWFKRVWTAMEFMRSGNIQMMLADDTLCPEQSNDPIFWKRLQKVWGDEKESKFLKKAQLDRPPGGRLLPWNLGQLSTTKSEGKTMSFGQAFAMLARRGCREERDFLYAMRSLLAADDKEKTKTTAAVPMGDDFETEYHRLARVSIQAGDFSPLLMAPSVPFVPDPRTITEGALYVGYNDVFTWGLGRQWSPPKYLDEISIPEDAQSTAVNVRLEAMGIVSTVHKLNRCYNQLPLGQDERLEQCAHITLQYTGPDVGRFVSALGSRLYGARDENLDITNNEDAIQQLLHDRFGSPGAGVWEGTGLHSARWLAEAMGLTKALPGQPPPVAWCSEHGGTIHGGGTRLNCLIGITCFTCHQTDVFRVFSFVPLIELRHATAYRIPGLDYTFSHRDGVALLEKNERVVGRMIWATPACECREMETRMVKLEMPGLPPRRVNT